jgi:hypothetical protein
MKRLVAAAALVGTLAVPGLAKADSATDAALGLGAFAVFNQVLSGTGVFGGGRTVVVEREVVVAPPPVVYAPPPPVVYAPALPPPVVYSPAPVIVYPSRPTVVYQAPPVVYAPPPAYGYYGSGHHHKHWKHWKKHHHRWD